MSNVFYGTKKIRAVPMDRLQYNEYRGWDLPADEDGSDPGYLVEYLDGGEPNHANHAGYISWSPAAQFEAAYQPVTNLSYGHALQALKEGHRVARAGWNGKGMWIALSPGAKIDLEHAKPRHAIRHRAAELEGAPDGARYVTLLPHIDMRAADGAMVIGWLASQTDMLADDWIIVGENP